MCGGRLAIVDALQRVEFVGVQSFPEAPPEIEDGIEATGRGPDDGEPLLAWELVAMLAIDALPDLEDRAFGVDDEAVEVEDQRVQRFFWKNSSMRRSMSARSFSERGIWRSFG